MEPPRRYPWRWIVAAFAAGLVAGIPLGVGAMVVLAKILATQIALP